VGVDGDVDLRGLGARLFGTRVVDGEVTLDEALTAAAQEAGTSARPGSFHR